MQDVLLQFHHRLPAMIVAVAMPVVVVMVIVPVRMVMTVVVRMVMPMMVVIMAMGVLMMVMVVVPFLRRQGYFWPFGIAAASANSAHSSLIIGRCRLRGFSHYESEGLHVQLFAGSNLFKKSCCSEGRHQNDASAQKVVHTPSIPPAHLYFQ